MHRQAISAVSDDKRTGSKTATMYPIVGCLAEAEKIVGADWRTVNAEQSYFLEQVLSPARAEVSAFSPRELASMASERVEAINQFLREQGFSIQLEAFQDSNSFGVASVLRVPAKWRRPGLAVELTTARGKFHAVSMKQTQSIGFFESSTHPNPIAVILTEGGGEIYMTIADQPLEGLEISLLLRGLSAAAEANDADLA